MSERMFIVGVGACTPVGRDAWSTAAAVRAGIAGFSDHPGAIDTVGEPFRVGLADWIDPRVGVADRLQALLMPSIEQALEPCGARPPPGRLGLALGVPAHCPGMPINLEATLGARISKDMVRTFDAAATFSVGHATGLLGLKIAVSKLLRGNLDACVVAAVDSHVAPLTLEWLESRGQIHGAGPLNNAWGFIPGEASAAILLMREGVANEHRIAPLADVLGTGTSLEENLINTRTICLGRGLTQAFQEALESLPTDRRVSDVYCDLNGDPYRADEYGFTCLRLRDRFESMSNFVAPADCFGDVGAAAGIVNLVLAIIAGCKGYSHGPTALVWASSESGERAAALIATKGSGRPCL